VHPDLFRDVSPEALMEEIYQRFLPFKLPGVYTVTLKAAE
jgi:hypothetical protein